MKSAILDAERDIGSKSTSTKGLLMTTTFYPSRKYRLLAAGISAAAVYFILGRGLDIKK